MAQNQEHFVQTLGQMRGLASSSQKAIDLSSEAIGQITGGESWIQIGPGTVGEQPLSSLAVFVRGKYPFFGESMEVYESSGLHNRRRTFPFPAPPSLIAVASLRTYYPRFAYPLAVSVPLTSERAQIFEFRIIGRGEVIQEWMKLYRSRERWLFAWEIHRGNKLLATWKEASFPDDWKLEPPTEPLDPKFSRTPEY
jgi:hypothetical protein